MTKSPVGASLAVLLAMLAACGGASPQTTTRERPAVAPTLAPSTSTGPGIVVAQGHGWTDAGLAGPMPAPGACHLRFAANGEALPDPACTPGAIDSAVTDTNIATTVCRPGGYTRSVRPPLSLTAPAKRELLAAYGIPLAQVADYELDHLVDLAAGGASDVRNLWPEPNSFVLYHGSSYIHNDKDAVESYTYHAICDGEVTVTAVQNAMATDWTTAVATLGLPPIPSDYGG